MLMALRFEPSRFFLKGKVTKQATYKNTLKEGKLDRREMNTKEDVKSRVRYWSWDHTGVLAGRDYEISEKQWVRAVV